MGEMTRLIDKKLADEVAEITRRKTREELISFIEKQAVIIKQLRSSEAERYASEIPTNCPLDKEYKRIFKEHGRLGDLDALEKEMAGGIKAGLLIDGYENYPNINNVDDCLELVKYADTIIEANCPVFIRTKSKSRIEPSAQPERKRGHWVGIDDEPCEVYECDVCGAVYDTVGNTWDLPNYCPECGADMREGEKE